MLIKTSEKTTAAEHQRLFLERCTLAEVNIADEFTRLAKTRAMAETPMESLR